MNIVQPSLLLILLLCAFAATRSGSAGEAPRIVTVTLQQGVDGYAGAEDTWFSSYRPPQNSKELSFGGAPVLKIFDRTGSGGEHTRSLLRFELSRVRGRIASAQLVLTKSGRSPNGAKYFNQTIALHRVADANAGWQAGSSNYRHEEDVATWANRSEPRTPWAGKPGLIEPGVDYVANPLARAQTGVDLKLPVTFTLNDVAFLNDWAADPDRNAGFLLREINPTASGGDTFFSSNADQTEYRPKLILQVEATTASGLAELPHPPIPVKFTLAEPGYVTLVIDDAAGNRVRNLVSETPFPAGENTAWWDGLDESGQADISPRGYYKIAGTLVAPGKYTVRGLVRKDLTLHYEFPIYNPGTPPWIAQDVPGSGWLADHSPPSEALFMPGSEPRVLIGSYIVEGGSSLAWLDLEGRKQRGMGWLGGGHWTGVSCLARDAGSSPLADIEVYAGTTFPVKAKKKDDTDIQELRLIGVRPPPAKENRVILVHAFPALPADPAHASLLGGLAVRNGLIFASVPTRNQLHVVDGRAGKLLRTLPLEDGRGMAFDAEGRLVVICGKRVVRLTVPQSVAEAAALDALPAGDVLVAKGLDDPQRLTFDAAGAIYVSDHGRSHNVKVFGADGRFVRAIGKPGVPAVGPYDEQRMNNPAGLAVTDDSHLWVAEADEAPRRVSVWRTDGTFVRGLYGGVRYGGGGLIDPRDATRFYYAPGEYGMEFEVDWQQGTSRLTHVYHRPAGRQRGEGGGPETPIDAFGRRYFTNQDNDWLYGTRLIRIWLLREGHAVEVAMAGSADNWPGFERDEFHSLFPNTDGKTKIDREFLKNWLFAWSDCNHDGGVQPAEVTLLPIPRTWIVPARAEAGLELMFGNGYRLAPDGVDDQGVPLYDMAKATAVFEPKTRSVLQAADLGDGWYVSLAGPISGYRDGRRVWTYPCRWPSLHAHYYDPLDPPAPGLIVGVTHVASQPLKFANSDVGPVLAATANNGTINLITRDGLYVGMVGRDGRVGKLWQATPAAPRGLDLSDHTFGGEHFFLNIAQTPDGKVYALTSFGIVRVGGLDSVRRLPDATLALGTELLAEASQYLASSATVPRRDKRSRPLEVPTNTKAPRIDGKLDDWAGGDWAAITTNRTTGTPVEAAVCVAGDRLFAAFRTGDARLLTTNSGEERQAIFKTGGGLDLMLGTDPAANQKRVDPVAGDIRLVVTQVQGKTVAMLYRAVVPGTATPVPFSSPWRTITIDRVEDVSDVVELATNRSGDYEVSVPLETLGLKPKPGRTIKADLGTLRGAAGRTTERVYWHNKATGLTADLPGEAMLTPALWGEWRIGAERNDNPDKEPQ
jgi:hypothetical protein